jgi:hypothetical protein
MSLRQKEILEFLATNAVRLLIALSSYFIYDMHEDVKTIRGQVESHAERISHIEGIMSKK